MRVTRWGQARAALPSAPKMWYDRGNTGEIQEVEAVRWQTTRRHPRVTSHQQFESTAPGSNPPTSPTGKVCPMRSGWPCWNKSVVITIAGNTVLNRDFTKFIQSLHARVEVILDGVPVAFIELDNLRKNKRAAGRRQDLADLENLT